MQNKDQRPHDYSETDLYPRPSHADWTYLEKYGVKASSGGGRSSARETIGTFAFYSALYIHLILTMFFLTCVICMYKGRVAAGAIAEKYLKLAYGIEIVAFVSSVGKIHIPTFSSSTSSSANPEDEDDTVEDALSAEYVNTLKTITREQVDAHPTRCPHLATADKMTQVRLSFLIPIYCPISPQ